MQIYLIAATALTDGMQRFLADRQLTWVHDGAASDAERAAEAAGRVCYMSFGDRQHRKSTAEYLANIIAQGHGSVLEHANFTLLVDGITRALSHQLVRHRVGFAYSQLSQQYNDESGATFAEPEGLSRDAGLQQRWNRWSDETLSLYGALLRFNGHDTAADGASLTKKERSRLARSIARSVLPNATLTTLVTTGNARAWRYLLRTRGDIAGDLEMRAYCVAAYRILNGIAPHLFAGFGIGEDALGSFVRTVD